MSVAVEISGVQAIGKLEVPIEPGTVVVLSGPNGSGKSTAIKAVQAGVKGTAAGSGLLPTDGKAAGAIRVPGATITIGARPGKARGKAEHNLVAVEDVSGIAKFVDPGIKDPVAADKRRIEELISISGVVGGREVFEEFLGKEQFESLCPEILSLCDMPLVDAVGAVKRLIESKARESESEVSELSGRIAEIGEVPERAALRVADSAAVKADLEAANKKLLTLQARAEAQAEAQAEVESLSVDVDIESLEKQHESAKLAGIAAAEAIATANVNHEAVVAEIDAQIAELQLRVQELAAQKAKQNADWAAAEARLCAHASVCVADIQAAATALSEAESRQERHRAAVERMKQNAVPAEFVEAAKADVDRLQSELVQAGIAEKSAEEADAKRQALTETKAKRERAEFFAATYRASAEQVRQILSNAVSAVPGFVVSPEMRLCVSHKRGEIPYADLSPGERVAKALDVLFSGVEVVPGTVPVMGLPQEAFEQLDGKNQRHVLDWAAKKGVCITTAVPSRDPEQTGISIEVLRK